ncbi:hypothetical protein [Halomonas sp. Mc5H-6]|uniref:response regulator n=1 Tax=Halomonas sp. Mc5H-6 TaxID=2954500 RepID=UPI002097035A|nr:hypothetical protein [Halomonas sp. Mc5H-6]MCO7247123.1 hypothetical protein [Halomonas sp. Mc5H-6]
MKVLIVEDQKEKGEDIEGYLKEIIGPELKIEICQSLRSGLKALLMNGHVDLVLLDMSMPNYDPGPDDPVGGTPESFAGKELLAQMSLRKLYYPVIVITQYATFAKGKIDLKDLDKFFMSEYSSFYCGSVYYSSAERAWKDDLKKLLDKVF